MGVWWKLPRAPGRSHRRYGERCATETAAVASRAADHGLDRAITSGTGLEEARRRSRISPCSVADTIEPFTRRAIRSIERPDGQLLPEVPRSPEVAGDPVQVLRERHEAEGLVLHARTGTPGWMGERLSVAYAIDVLHPLAAGG